MIKWRSEWKTTGIQLETVLLLYERFKNKQNNEIIYVVDISIELLI